MRIVSIASLVAAALPSCISLDAQAQITNASYSNASNYHYRVLNMTDLDQRRSASGSHPGLPGNGSMYCVPTSAMNLICFAARHGFPGLDPGDEGWQLQSNYDDATAAILEMGVWMGTTSSGGTGGSGAAAGFQTWLNIHGGTLLTRHRYSLGGGYPVRAFRMAKKAAQGSVVMFAYGRYKTVGTVGGLPVLDRTGGHAVTLVEAKSSGGGPLIRYRDPADDPADASQSTFTSKEVYPVAVSGWINGVVQTLTALQYPSGDEYLRMIDSFTTLKPIYGISFSNSDGWVIQQTSPYAFDGAVTAPVALSGISSVVDLHIDADGDDAIAIVKPLSTSGITQLRRIDTFTGEFETLSAFTTLERCCVGRDGRIYAHDGGKLYRLNADGSTDGATSAIPTPTALAFDDIHDHIAVLSVPDRKIARLDSDLDTFSTFTLPTFTPFSGNAWIASDPGNTRLYFCSEASNNIYLLLGTGPFFSFQTITVPGLVDPSSISVGDDGALYVLSGGKVKVLREGRSGWAFDPTSPFHNTPANTAFQIDRSRTNHDPAIHDTPGWADLDPSLLVPLSPSTVDCGGDLNGDDVVNAADLSILLGSWGAAGLGDIDDDGTIGAADLGLLLGAWGACP